MLGLGLAVLGLSILTAVFSFFFKLLFVVLILVLIFSLFNFRVMIDCNNNNVLVKISWMFFNFKVYDHEKSKIKVKKDGNIDYKLEKKVKLDDVKLKCQDIKNLYENNYLEIGKILTSGANSVKIKMLDLSIVVGLEDTIATGLSIPIISSLISMAIGIISGHIEMPKNFKFDVIPNFTEQIFKYNGRLVVKVITIRSFKMAIKVGRFWKSHRYELKRIFS